MGCVRIRLEEGPVWSIGPRICRIGGAGEGGVRCGDKGYDAAEVCVGLISGRHEVACFGGWFRNIVCCAGLLLTAPLGIKAGAVLDRDIIDMACNLAH